MLCCLDLVLVANVVVNLAAATAAAAAAALIAVGTVWIAVFAVFVCPDFVVALYSVIVLSLLPLSYIVPVSSHTLGTKTCLSSYTPLNGGEPRSTCGQRGKPCASCGQGGARPHGAFQEASAAHCHGKI
eukprot:331530-Pelagomonas_calceolata.AAC.6